MAASLALKAVSPLWLTHASKGKIALWRHPNIREVHWVIASMRKRLAVGPVTLSNQLAWSVIAGERRGVEFVVRFGSQQCGFPSLTAQLILDEPSPVRDRAVDATGRPHNPRVVHCRPVL